MGGGYKNGIYLINGTAGNHIFHCDETNFTLIFCYCHIFKHFGLCTYVAVQELTRFHGDRGQITGFL